MRLRESCRVNGSEPGHEGRLLGGRPHPLRRLHDRPPEGVEARLLGSPQPAPGIHLARLEVEVAAARVGARVDLPCPAAGLDPRKARPEVGLVGRLVLAEAGVAVDPERRAPGIGAEREAACLEALRQRAAERLQGLLQQALVVRLARREPGPVVVAREVGQELDPVGRESRERGDGAHRVPPGVGSGRPERHRASDERTRPSRPLLDGSGNRGDPASRDEPRGVGGRIVEPVAEEGF